ncbi:hypothetical protein ACK2IE_08175 [Clostridioides difficile]|nr:hypothetical protein Q0Y04_20510 [Clostridioides difficile]
MLDTSKQNEDKKIYNYLLSLNKGNNLDERPILDELNCNISSDTFEKKIYIFQSTYVQVVILIYLIQVIKYQMT